MLSLRMVPSMPSNLAVLSLVVGFVRVIMLGPVTGVILVGLAARQLSL